MDTVLLGDLAHHLEWHPLQLQDGTPCKPGIGPLATSPPRSMNHSDINLFSSSEEALNVNGTER